MRAFLRRNLQLLLLLSTRGRRALHSSFPALQRVMAAYTCSLWVPLTITFLFISGGLRCSSTAGIIWHLYY